MSVNLVKHKVELLKAWEDLHDPNSKNDWVIFGYDGHSSDLKVQSQGEDGIDEMVDDLNGGKIQYAGLRVKDPNTDLPKIVFINWQGEGVPATVKGKCANHLRDITNLFKGAHVQINARNEDDVEEETILDKVKKSSGANYSFHKEKKQAFIPQGKIGSVYERQRPDMDPSLKEKYTFWAKTEKEEKLRKEEEEKRVREERIKESRQRAEREKKEEEARKQWQRERAKSIEEQRRNEKGEMEKRAEEEKQRYQAVLKEAQKDDDEFRKRSDSERRKRIQEANELVKGRQGAKDVFTEQPHTQSPPIPAPKKKTVPLPPSSKPKQHVPEPARQPSPEPVRQPSPEPVRQPSPEPVRQPSPEPVRQPSPEPITAIEKVETSGLTAKALFDYQAADETEITFDPGDVITNIEQIDDGWWRGEGPSGKFGLFPANYVELVEETSPLPAEPTTQTSNGISARALYDYQAADETEITFDPGDVITNIEQIDDGWWRGEGPNGKFGLFPANYVELV